MRSNCPTPKRRRCERRYQRGATVARSYRLPCHFCPRPTLSVANHSPTMKRLNRLCLNILPRKCRHVTTVKRRVKTCQRLNLTWTWSRGKVTLPTHRRDARVKKPRYNTCKKRPLLPVVRVTRLNRVDEKTIVLPPFVSVVGMPLAGNGSGSIGVPVRSWNGCVDWPQC